MLFIVLSNLRQNGQEKKYVNGVKVKLRNGQLKTNLHIKPTGTCQFLVSTSCQP